MDGRAWPHTHGIRHAQYELGSLSFARVTKIVVDDDHRVSGDGNAATYSYFYGFATEVDVAVPRHIWFKSPQFRRSVYVGPIVLRPCMTHRALYPRRNDIICGIVSNDARPAFQWWVHGALPLLNFRRIVVSGKLPRVVSYRQDYYLPELMLDKDVYPEQENHLSVLAAVLMKMAFGQLQGGTCGRSEAAYVWHLAAWTRCREFFACYNETLVHRGEDADADPKYNASTLDRYLEVTAAA